MSAPRNAVFSAVALAAAVAFSPVAVAHDALTSSSPAEGAVLTSAPAQMKLTFSESVLKVGTQLAITAPGQATPATLTTTVAGNVVSAPFTSAGNGHYTLTWRVTSADGHPVSGQIHFSLKDQATSVASSPATSAKSSDALGVAPSMGSANASPSTVQGPSTPTTNEPGDNQPWLVVGGVLVAAALLGVGWYVARGRVKDDI